MAEEDYDVVIVGGGVAGLTAALYASRQKLRTLVIAKDIGGQATLAPHIENYPGAPMVSGFELAQTVMEQAQRFGAEIAFDEAVEAEERDGRFVVRTRGGIEYSSLALILAFGKSPRELGVPGEKRLAGKGVSYCAICDAPLYREKRVLVVGWGEPALEAVKLLCKYGNRVYLAHRGRSRVPRERIEAECGDRFEELPETVVKEVKGEERVESVVLENSATGERRELQVDGVFVELGYEAKTEWVKGFVELNENGEIIVDRLCETSRPGVFAAGDVTDIPYKQAVIAAAQGAVAALSAYNYLQKKRGGAKIKADWRELLEEG